MLSAPVRNAIVELVRDLVNARYEKLAEDGRAGRLTAEELSAVLREFPCELVELPSHAFDLAERYESVKSGTYSLDLPLWTKEEGRSDLTLSLTVSETESNVDLEIDDLHVL